MAITQQVGVPYEDRYNLLGLGSSVPATEQSRPEMVEAAPKPQATRIIEEFPYRPATAQHSDHARRISVTTLKSKEESDLGQTPRSSARRESWQGHSHRDAPNHRVRRALSLPSCRSDS